MDLKQLEYFVRVAELGSFTRAAIVLDIVQPALSRQVRMLELEFKQTLLLRNGRGVVTPDAGKLLLEYGRGILYQVERLREELGRARGALVGHVALGLPPSLLKILAVPIFREFREKFPSATLAIREGMSTAMHESLVSGRLDVALLYNAVPSPDVDLTPLLEEELFLVAPQGDGGPSAPIAIGELPGYPLIVPSRPNAIRMLIEGELANLGLRPCIAFEVDGVNAILELVAEGFGYAILSQTAVDNLASERQYRLRSVQGDGLKARLSLAVNAHRQVTATQRALIELIGRVVAQHLARAPR
jgi:LysR family nitrogen assimilation transcriptional regulator